MNIPRTKICFHLWRTEVWPGGLIYLANLLQTLKDSYAASLSLCLFDPSARGRVPKEIEGLVDEVLVPPTPRRWTMPWFLDCVARRLLRHDLLDNRLFTRHGVQIVIFGRAPRGSGIPAVGWIPDFQHVHLPEAFSADECQSRERSFLRVAKESARVIVMSETVRCDFVRKFPQYAQKVRVIHPVSYIPPSVCEGDPRAVCQVYHLPERFVYLPSQFWKHKNHGVAIQALARLRGRGLKVFLVCSGYLGDYRHPEYPSELLRELSQRNLRDQVALLGVIPRQDVYQLIRQSICVLNPSLFEGYGMTVDEARSIGKSVILSDIPAHREQNPPKSVFFNPRDPEDLADRLGRTWCDASPGPDWELESSARDAQPERSRTYAKSFVAVLEEILRP